MLLDSSNNISISRPRILKRHRQHSPGRHINIDRRNRLIINLRHVIHQIIPLIDLIQRTVIDEPDDLGHLTDHEPLILADIFPHDQVLGDGFHEDVVLVAFLDGGEGVRDGDSVGKLLVVALEVHEGDGEQGGGGGDVQVHVWALLYAGRLVLVYVVCAGYALGGLHQLAALDESDQALLDLEVSEHFLLVPHAQTHHAQRPACSQRVTLSVNALVRPRELADLRQRCFGHCPVACSLVQQTQSNKCACLHVDGDLDVD